MVEASFPDYVTRVELHGMGPADEGVLFGRLGDLDLLIVPNPTDEGGTHWLLLQDRSKMTRTPIREPVEVVR